MYLFIYLKVCLELKKKEKVVFHAKARSLIDIYNDIQSRYITYKI